ncbi:cyclophilin-like fold protein [Paraburkholderia phymatum]|nr:cyclophilin-like fold protein [Paraburkholderia phymatum]
MRVSGKELRGTLGDNPTAHEFASLLPIHVVMSDLFGREKAGSLPRAISVGGPRSSSYEVGDIGYWSPGHDLAIYYRQDGDRIPSPGIIKVGRLDSGIEAFVVTGSLDVIIERE